ncbi:hypothetical protein RZR97_02755 [Hydrogenimonas thermophila]|uniref:fimbrial biogenesis chaperone n=1 Tax=Hydrogenimonas thermophila TaxID=223786 RepID=UPI00293742B7|nr:hypothetical protein [Hydrogenimonas thermophila]WOE70501.1 hypothetical protein RZR91_02775 [Hydrogenimonas thermophila]WOE73017.1 hypothetical protein RZR97_02755 [Hydrogenimonas thermophila]
MKRLATAMILSSVAAFALTVHPIPVKIEGKKYAEFHLGDDTGKYQVFIKKWKQENGEDVLEDTKEIFVFPKIFQAPKTIKIYAKSKNIEQEQAYRLILKELNIKKRNDNKTVVLKTLSIPVFVKPKNETPNLKTECVGHTLRLINNGNVHFKILSIANKKEVIYVLSNQTKEVQDVENSGVIETNRGFYEYTCKEVQ